MNEDVDEKACQEVDFDSNARTRERYNKEHRKRFSKFAYDKDPDNVGG